VHRAEAARPATSSCVGAATLHDADFWVDGHVLYLSRFIKEYTPRMTLTWGQNLIDFSPKVSTIGQVAGVAKRFVLREIPLDFLVAVGYDFDRESIVISVVPGAAAATTAQLLGSLLTIIDQPIGSGRHRQSARDRTSCATC
jgi:hypothetical protein